ncbi:zinc finger BED domain-containing protein RICESLEEPER 2 [Cajanus cajan]|uniref:AC transposase n=1 Tax=Cajanus cajan TaxID=3821 RepID=A0A151SEI9_CAJCA|nr:zinc finger BED domain-containing protein RICESLEEPER 2 [Cajanus cajan]KYP53189.1 Putative AC transposase [Cajanus cajan]
MVSSPSLARPKIDQQALRIAIVKMFVAMELPFRCIEHEAFREFLSIVAPSLNVISRTTLARDIYKLRVSERENLKEFISQNCQRVCLTTDTWTSSQNLSYMCLTAHFIDNNWKLQKKVLNFCQVTSHTGKTMAKKVEHCLSKWGLNRVLTLTVDNASSNDVGIQYLKKRLISWNSLVMKGDYIHMRCCAHILNLIVKEGFKDNIDAILRIRGAVNYVRSSPSRLAKFKTCVEKQNIEYKGLVCLDVETRWNSTYLMLEAALKLHKAFEELEMQDKKYIEELEKVKGVSSYADWEFVRAILPFLKLFYDATLRMSGSIYVTSNIYMFEVFGIGKKISQMCNSRDINVCIMAENMKKKYDKYWGNADRLNMFLLIALVLHPGYKLQFMHWLISQNFDGEVASSLKEKVESSLKLLFQEYNGGRDEIEVNSQEARFNEGGSDDPYGYNHFFQRTSSNKSELSKYLEEALEESYVDLDILNWWKLNSGRFPILSKMGRDLLVIPVSTVAFESAFSTGGRVHDPYRSSPTPRMVEALICTQDWLKRTQLQLFSNENGDFEELEKFEQK